MRRSALRLLAIFLATCAVLGSTSRAPAEPRLTSLKSTFFVVPESNDAAASMMMSIGTANEIRKALEPFGGATPWVMPEPDWKTANLMQQCLDDPEAVGGVVVAFYAGAASHFYLLYQSETQTFSLTAEVISCNRSPDGAKADPTVVGVIAELPGAHGTPWVVRRSQVSIPLISFAGLATLFQKGGTSSKTTSNNVTTAAVFAALVGQASTRDIPGYSTPLKLRYGSQEAGVDLVRAMRDLCTSHADLPADASSAPRDKLCTAIGFTLDPAKVKAQQDALDAYEAAKRRGEKP
jgi:hypothetical protein